MSRVIKFRAWDGASMIEPTSVINSKAAINISCSMDDKVMTDDEGVHYYCNWDMDKTTDYPLMQYTGLTDKNGVEIYEGDIVINLDTSGSGRKRAFRPREVRWFKDSCNFNVSRPTALGATIEVIGNIHSNPELLEK